ncbi:MAG: MFS transporter [Actinomycetota bacterium]
MSATATTQSLGRSRAAVTATFAAHALVAGSVGPWIPRLKAESHLDAAGLGLALTGYAVGLVLGTRLAGPALRWAGGRRVVRGGIPLFAAGLAALPYAEGLSALTAAFAALGLASGLLDVAMNTEVVAVEQRFDRRIMSTMHGTWSVAMLAGAVLAAAALAAGISIRVALPLVAALLVAGSFPILRWLPSPHEARSEPPEATAPVGGRSRTGRVFLLCLVGFGAFLTEGVAAEWSAVYLNESVGTNLATAGLGVVAFSVGMTISRFAADRLSLRFDPAVLVRVGTTVAAVALITAVVVNEAIVTMAALIIIGLSIGPAVPLAFRSAGSLVLGPGRTALGLVVTAGYVGSIVGPLTVGFTADQLGLRTAFAIPAATCLLAAIGAGALREERTPGT